MQGKGRGEAASTSRFHFVFFALGRLPAPNAGQENCSPFLPFSPYQTPHSFICVIRISEKGVVQMTNGMIHFFSLSGEGDCHTILLPSDHTYT